MPQSEFYVHNLGRAFPLVNHDDDELFATLVDGRVTLRPEVGYIHGKHKVFLHCLGKLGVAQAINLGVDAGAFVVFTSSAPQFTGLALLGALGQAERFGEVLLSVRNLGAIESVLANEAPTVPAAPVASSLASGWVAVGDVSAFPSGVVYSDLYLEPTSVFATPEVDTGIGSTKIYNQRLTSWTPPAGCEHTANVIDLNDPYQLVCEIVNEPVELKGGKQVRLDQATSYNQITVSANGGTGDGGELCTPIPLAPGVFDYDTAPQCNEVLRSINGVSGPFIDIGAFTGVSVQAHPQLNRIVIDIGGKDLSTCASEEDAAQVECFPTVIDEEGNEINCGTDNEPAPCPGEPDSSTGYEIVITPGPEPDEPGPTLGCRWVADGLTGWTLDSYPCVSPNGCAEPDKLPTYENELLTTSCLPYIDPNGFLIRNGDFTAPVPLSAWDARSTVVADDLPSSPGTALAKFESFAGGQVAELSQAKIGVVDGFYVLQAETALPAQGELTLKLWDRVNSRFVQQITIELESAQLTEWVSDPFRIDDTVLDFVVEYRQPNGLVGYAGFFDLVKQ